MLSASSRALSRRSAGRSPCSGSSQPQQNLHDLQRIEVRRGQCLPLQPHQHRHRECVPQIMQGSRHTGRPEGLSKHRRQSRLADGVSLKVEKERGGRPIIRSLAPQRPDLRRANLVDIALRAVDQADRRIDRARLVTLGDCQRHADQRMIVVIQMRRLRNLEDGKAAKLLAPQSRRQRPFRHQPVGHLEMRKHPAQLIDTQRSRQTFVLGDRQDIRRHDPRTPVHMRQE